MVQIRFVPSGTTCSVNSGTKILRAAIKHKVPIRFGCASCRCGTCAVRIRGEGTLSSMAENERQLLATMNLSTSGDIRLSWQAKALDGTTEVDLDFQDEYDPAG